MLKITIIPDFLQANDHIKLFSSLNSEDACNFWMKKIF